MMEREENRLERLLRLALDEPAHRPEFYRVLLESEVYILGSVQDGDEAADGELERRHEPDAGRRIAIRNWERQDGTPVIPFFSSRYELAQAVDEPQDFLCIGARTLFDMTRGATLVLNPASGHFKEFSPPEVAQLLDAGMEPEPVERVVEEETQVLLGQPSVYPDRMVDSLIQLLAKHDNVQRAWLAQIHDPSVDEMPHLIIGLEAQGDIGPVVREAGTVAMATAPEGEAVDLFQVDASGSGLSDYFLNHTEPFYERRWGARLATPPEPGRA